MILTFKQSQTIEGDGGGAETRYFSQTLLKGIRVLALDQAADNPSGQAKVSKTATLEVTGKQAETIMLGLEIGDLALSLQSLNQGDGTLSLLTDSPASRDKSASRSDRSYTRDVDILEMVGDPMGLQPPIGMRQSLSVLRGSEAKDFRY
ncbi:MAG: hypothetical protein HC826_01825 [Rhodospirillales bacterium]|nr:hypothetical protein [Rhodospirillales bacterium]